MNLYVRVVLKILQKLWSEGVNCADTEYISSPQFKICTLRNIQYAVVLVAYRRT